MILCFKSQASFSHLYKTKN